jgi:hypothetical protein
MWCLRCYEPVRLLTPREPQLPTVQFLRDPDAHRERSRWRPGVNTFGPVGRVVTTAIVLAVAPWSTNAVALVVSWPAYLVLAGLILRSTWKKDDVVATTVRELVAAHGPFEPGPEPAPIAVPRSTAVAWAAMGIIGAGGAVAWFASGSVGRGVIGICTALAALVLAVRWLSRA